MNDLKQIYIDVSLNKTFYIISLELDDYKLKYTIDLYYNENDLNIKSFMNVFYNLAVKYNFRYDLHFYDKFKLNLLQFIVRKSKSNDMLFIFNKCIKPFVYYDSLNMYRCRDYKYRELMFINCLHNLM